MTNRHPNVLLRRARKALQWNQADLAGKLGVSPITIGRWERGSFTPTRHYQMELSQLFGLSPQALGFLIETPSREVTKEKSFIVDPMIPSSQSFIGRDELLDHINDQLQHQHAIALHGLPGIGKTALASVLASTIVQHRLSFDGVLWVGLGPHPKHDRHLARWETLLGRAESDPRTARSPEEWSTALRMAIGTRRMLLIIDDAWSIEDALLFKVGGSHCVHVLTTRFPTLALQFASDGGAFAIQELYEQESMDILMSLAPGIKRSDPNARLLVQSVNGLPLALTLIGGYLYSQGRHARRIHLALERLQNAEERLRLSQPSSPLERSPSLASFPSISLQATIEISIFPLSELAQQVLGALSAFPAKPNSFSEEAALSVADTSPEVLDQLIDTGLLEWRETNRYCLHQVIADYAHSKLKRESADERFVAYYANLVEKHTTNYKMMEHESDNILAALDIAHRLGRQEDLIRGIGAFGPFLLLRGLYERAEYHLLNAYEAAKGTGGKEVPLLLLLGQTSQKRGNYLQAVDLFQQGLMLARQQESAEWMSAFLADLGWVTWKQGHYPQAEKHLREGLGLAYQINDKERICKFLRVLGAVLSSLGRYAEGQKYLREGLALARLIGNPEQICVLLIDLGVSFQETMEFSLAEEFSREGLALAGQIGHREWMSLAYLNLTDLSLVLHHYSDAQKYALQGLALAEQIGNREWICGNLANLAIAAREQGDFSTAQTHFLRAIQLAQQQGRPYMTFMIIYEYACLALEQKDRRVAETLLKEIHAIIPEGDQGLSGLWTFGMARLAALQGNLQEARRLGEESKNILRAIQHGSTKDVEQWLSNLSERMHPAHPYEDTAQFGIWGVPS